MELQWPLILFTTLTAWACGVLGGAGALALKGAGKKSQQLLAILSCVLLAAGGIADLNDARDFVALGADRLGTSRIVKAVKELEAKGEL